MPDSNPAALPMLGGQSPHAGRRFGDRPIWSRAADGTVRWLTPRQMGLDEATIADIERLEAEGEAAPRPEPVQPTPEPIPFPQPARVVFPRLSARDGRKLVRQAEQAAQEALL